MPDVQMVLSKTDDIKKANRVLNICTDLLKTVRSAFRGEDYKRITDIPEGDLLREPAQRILTAITDARQQFERIFSLSGQTREARNFLIRRGGTFIIEAYLDLVDLESYYRYIRDTGKLPKAPFYSGLKFWGEKRPHFSVFNDATTIRRPFINLIQKVNKAVYGRVGRERDILEKTKPKGR